MPTWRTPASLGCDNGPDFSTGTSSPSVKTERSGRTKSSPARRRRPHIGSVVVNETEIRRMRERDLRRIRGRLVSLISQNPAAALSPALRLRAQFREARFAHDADWTGEGLQRTRHLLAACGLPETDEFLWRYHD